MTSPARSARPVLQLMLLAVVAAMMAAMASLASAAPATQVWTGHSGGATPDIERTGVEIFKTDGSPVTVSSGEVGTLNFTINGVPYVGLCVDTARAFDDSAASVDVSAVTAPTHTDRAVAWIISNLPQGATTPDKASKAAASQIAVWLLRGQVNADNPSNDAALNAAAKALRDEALAATDVPASLVITPSAPAAGATTTQVTISARPGAVVTLSVTSGNGTLSAAQVTIGASGTAMVTLTTTGPGTVALAARTAGDPVLYRVDPVKDTQTTSYAAPVVLDAATNVTFTAAPTTVTTPSTPTSTPAPAPSSAPAPAPAPTVVVAQAPRAALHIVKAGPARATAGMTLRYTVKVTNTGKAPARNVVVTDRLPGGMTLVGRQGTRSGASVSFRVGTLAPGASRVIQVTVRSRTGLVGRRVNVATATATGVARVTARAATRFVGPKARTQPAVVAPAVTG